VPTTCTSPFPEHLQHTEQPARSRTRAFPSFEGIAYAVLFSNLPLGPCERSNAKTVRACIMPRLRRSWRLREAYLSGKAPMKSLRDGINPSAKPSGTGCAECLVTGSWWFHLRRCAECGHIGCCDSSPNQHASKHFAETGHPVIRSFEPGERWFFDYRTQDLFSGPTLDAPDAHPIDQPVPGPAGRVPPNWQDLLHE
jgi:hypothetical protein